MKYIFTHDKDGHHKGEVIDLEPTDFRLMYWTRKQVIEPFFREKELEIMHNEPVFSVPEEVAEKKPVRRKRK
jgi:hypothetical protein